MFDKQVMKKLEGLLNQMTPTQKNKLSNLMKDEDSLKQALSKISPEAAKKAVEKAGVDDIKGLDVNEILKDIQNKL